MTKTLTKDQHLNTNYMNKSKTPLDAPTWLLQELSKEARYIGISRNAYIVTILQNRKGVDIDRKK